MCRPRKLFQERLKNTKLDGARTELEAAYFRAVTLSQPTWRSLQVEHNQNSPAFTQIPWLFIEYLPSGKSDLKRTEDWLSSRKSVISAEKPSEMLRRPDSEKPLFWQTDATSEWNAFFSTADKLSDCVVCWAGFTKHRISAQTTNPFKGEVQPS